MRRRRITLVLASVALAAGCATAPARPPATAARAATPPPSADASPYGLFLAGQAAANSGQSGAAAAYFGKAAVGEGGAASSLLGERAFTAALLAGDISRAAAIAPTGPGTDPAIAHLSALARAVDAMARGDGRLAHQILSAPADGGRQEVAASLLAPFAAAMAGDWNAATVHVVISGEPISQFFANLDQGELFERAHRFEEAETTYRAILLKGDPGGLVSLRLGALLERRGERADAVAIYDRALAANPKENVLRLARERAAAGKAAPPLPPLRQSAAESLIAPATALLLQKQQQIALVYLRLALRLDPTRDEAWVMAGDVLATDGDVEAARAAYLAPRPGSDQFESARGKLAWSFQGAGDKATALKTARETLAADPTNQDLAVTLADLLRADERYAESIAVLDKLISDAGDKADWRLLYMRAVDLEESGRWPEAERDLKRALAQKPDEPELLNFLGYSWIDHGEKLPEAMAMVEKAVRLDPQSGAMIDSLGWGYYRTGDYQKAVEKLEVAVVLEPGDPDVNNHLGDAYWRVGRKTEAQFQWRRVLTLEPSAKLRSEVEGKLKDGLDPGPPARVATE